MSERTLILTQEEQETPLIKSPTRRKLESLRHLARGPLPLNLTHLESVKNKAVSSYYEKNRDELVHDLKNDPALLLHLIKKLPSILSLPSAGFDPITTIKQLEALKLQQLLDINQAEASPHQLSEMSKLQAHSLQQMLVSTHAAAELALEVNLSADHSFCGATLRQLGLSLIAWNFPRIYQQAISSHRKSNANLNLELAKYLGVTPQEISCRFATEWQLTKGIQGAVAAGGSKTTQRFAEFSNGNSPSIIGICEVAELYAQLKDPTNYPHAENEWQVNESAIKERLGGEVFDRINKKVEDTFAIYINTSPKVLALPLTLKYRDEKSHQALALRRMQNNHYVQKCPEALRHKFMVVYQQMKEGNVSAEGISSLVEVVAPALGFKRGCLFLLDKKDLELKPALRFGPLPLSEYHQFLRSNRTEITSNLDCSTPFRTEGYGVNGELSSQIYGSLEHPDHPGALYMEMSTRRNEQDADSTITYFQALRRALKDCLG